MGKNKTEIDVGTALAEAHLDALIQKAKALNDELKRAGSALGSDPSTANAANFFATAQRLGAVQSAIGSEANLKGSASVGANSGAGAFAPAAQFKNISIADPGAALGVLQSANLPVNVMGAAARYLAEGSIPIQQGTPVFSGSSYVQQIISSAQTSQQQSARPSGSFNSYLMPGQAEDAVMRPVRAPGAQGTGGYVPFAPNPPAPGSFSLIGVGRVLSEPDNTVARWQARFSQQDAQLGRTGQALMGSALYAGASYVGASLDYATERTRSGGADFMAQGRNLFGTAGAILGGIAGSPFGPAGVAVGTGIGAGLGQSVGNYMTAPRQNLADMRTALIPLYAFGGTIVDKEGAPLRRTDWGGQGNARYASDADMIARQTVNALYINNRLGRQGFNDEFRLTPQQLINGTADIGEAIIAGGGNPFAPGSQNYDSAGAFYKGRASKREAGFKGFVGSIRALYDIVTGKLPRDLEEHMAGRARGDETVSEMYERRIAGLFFNDEARGRADLRPILAGLPETGGNIADILMKQGPQATETWLRIQNDEGKSEVPAPELARVNRRVREENRRAALGATQARGSGGAMESAFDTALETISSLPDGANSLEAAQLRVKRRAARNLRFEQEDITNYSLGMTVMQGQMDRLDALPYMPGNRMYLSGQMIQQNKAQIGVIRHRRDALRQRGDLTEEQELQMTQQEQSLMTSSAYLLSDIVDNVPNRLPALSAGRPGGAGFRRLNTSDLVAIQMGRSGIPYRGAGAQNGAQLKAQDDFLAPVADGLDFTAHNRMSNLNQMGRGGGGGGLDVEDKALFRDIANLLRRAFGGGANGSQRPGEAASQAGGVMGRYLKIGETWTTQGRTSN